MITHIALHNFKCFEVLDLELAPLTLFTGINVMGKSSVIQSLMLLMQSYELKYLQNENKVELDHDFVNLETAEDLCFDKAKQRKVAIEVEWDKRIKYKWEIDARKFKESILPCSVPA